MCTDCRTVTERSSNPKATGSTAHRPSPLPGEKPSDRPPQRGAGSSSPPTTLVDLETSLTPFPDQTRPQRDLHSEFAATRHRIWAALESDGGDDLTRRANRLSLCCWGVVIWRHASGSPVLAPSRCRDRLCPLCSIQRARKAAVRMGEAARSMNAARMVTLTAPHVDIPLADHLAALRRAFGHLRKHPDWKSNVVGGLYAIECTRNADSGLWHPHVHVLCDGEYFPWEKLREAWRQALNRQSSVWSIPVGGDLRIQIELIRDRRRAAQYVAKYLCKPATIDRWPLEAIREFARALHGGRLLHTFGNLHGANLDPTDSNRPEGASERVASLPWVCVAAKLGSERGRVACLLFRMLFPVHDRWVPRHLETVPKGAIQEGESLQSAFLRLAAAAEREVPALMASVHKGEPPDPAPLIPRTRELQGSLGWVQSSA